MCKLTCYQWCVFHDTPFPFLAILGYTSSSSRPFTLSESEKRKNKHVSKSHLLSYSCFSFFYDAWPNTTLTFKKKGTRKSLATTHTNTHSLIVIHQTLHNHMSSRTVLSFSTGFSPFTRSLCTKTTPWVLGPTARQPHVRSLWCTPPDPSLQCTDRLKVSWTTLPSLVLHGGSWLTLTQRRDTQVRPYRLTRPPLPLMASGNSRGFMCVYERWLKNATVTRNSLSFPLPSCAVR